MTSQSRSKNHHCHNNNNNNTVDVMHPMKDHNYNNIHLNTENDTTNVPQHLHPPPPPTTTTTTTTSDPNDFHRCTDWGRCRRGWHLNHPTTSSTSTHTISAPSTYSTVQQGFSKRIVTPLYQVGTNVVTTVTDVWQDVIPPVHHIFHVLPWPPQPQQQQQQHYPGPIRIRHTPDIHHSHHHHNVPSVTKSTASSNCSITSSSSSASSSASSSLRPSQPNIRLLDSFRKEAMLERNDSFYSKSIVLPIFHFIWLLLLKWYDQLKRILQSVPILFWPVLLLWMWYMPLIPMVVLPTTTIVYHYTSHYYQYWVLPTPKRVLEMFDFIQSLVQNWWIRFVGRTTTSTSCDDDDAKDRREHHMNVRTRKRTALAVSIAAHHVWKQSKQKPASSI